MRGISLSLKLYCVLPFLLEKMSQLQKCKEFLADLSNQMSDMERSQNSRISSVERVCPSVGNPATTSTSPLLPSEQSNLEHQQVLGYTPRNCHNQAGRQRQRRRGSWNQPSSNKSRHSQNVDQNICSGPEHGPEHLFWSMVHFIVSTNAIQTDITNHLEQRF